MWSSTFERVTPLRNQCTKQQYIYGNENFPSNTRTGNDSMNYLKCSGYKNASHRQLELWHGNHTTRQTNRSQGFKNDEWTHKLKTNWYPSPILKGQILKKCWTNCATNWLWKQFNGKQFCRNDQYYLEKIISKWQIN